MTKSKYDPYREEILSGKITAKEIAKKIGAGCKETHIYAAKRRYSNPDGCKNSLRNWRKKHREKANERNRQYRAQYSQCAHNKRARWTEKDDLKVLQKDRLAKELAKELGRTIIAIYSRRVFLNKQRKII